MSYSYQGHVSAALVLGGVDITGPHLHTVSLNRCYLLRKDFVLFVVYLCYLFMHRYTHTVQLTHYHLLQWVLVLLLLCPSLRQSTKKV